MQAQETIAREPAETDASHAIHMQHEAILNSYLTPDPLDKIAIRFRAVGRAPILKQQVYRIASMQRFITATDFLKRQLGLSLEAPIYVYVNMSFMPAPDEILLNLFQCFKSDNQLLLSYSLTPAFG